MMILIGNDWMESAMLAGIMHACRDSSYTGTSFFASTHSTNNHIHHTPTAYRPAGEGTPDVTTNKSAEGPIVVGDGNLGIVMMFLFLSCFFFTHETRRVSSHIPPQHHHNLSVGFLLCMPPPHYHSSSIRLINFHFRLIYVIG